MSTSYKSRAGWKGSETPRIGGSPRAGSVSASVPREVRESVSVLVVDDEHTLREGCASLLRPEGYQVTLTGRSPEAADLIRRRHFDVILADLYLPEMTGMELLSLAQKHSPDSIFIIMTGNPSVESSIEGLRAGAWDYLTKPFSASHLHIVLGRAAHAVAVARERESKHGFESEAMAGAAGEVGILGRSPGLVKAVELAHKVAQTDASIFLTGESGTGKEMFANFIHRESRRSSRTFVPVNCAAMPEALLESEMFGHVEGAFTGAVREKRGLLEAAHGGTLFLDELTEMPMSIQAKLLRVIQDGVVRRVGSTQTDAVVNVRFVAATNSDPADAIKDGSLRQDLHYRLRVVPIHLPPLRERREDIPILAEHFLASFWERHRGHEGMPAPEFSEGALSALMARSWRGNVRELRNVIEHLTVLAEPGSVLQAQEIPFIEDGGDPVGAELGIRNMVRGQDYHTARELVLADFERGYLEYVVSESKGNISDAARMAGVDRTTLYRLMEKHGTNRDLLLDGADH
ncbi:MAG: sigma-54 dependent transcriptional regulator [Longimicrobiales bacterium]